MSVQWSAPHERRPVPRRSECDGYDETLDDVYGGMVLATIIVLSATVTGMVLLAAGVWLAIKLIGG